MATGQYSEVFDACYHALRFGLPQTTLQPFPTATMLKICGLSKRMLSFQWDPILKQLLIEKDPLERIAIALQSKREDIITATLLDAHASLEELDRCALSSRLFPLLVEKYACLPAIIFENLSMDIQRFHTLKRTVEQIPTFSNQYKLADKISQVTSTLDEDEGWIEDVLWLGFQEKILHDIPTTVNFARRLNRICRRF